MVDIVSFFVTGVINLYYPSDDKVHIWYTQSLWGGNEIFWEGAKGMFVAINSNISGLRRSSKYSIGVTTAASKPLGSLDPLS